MQIILHQPGFPVGGPKVVWAPKTPDFFFKDFLQEAKANCDFSSSNLRELNRSDMNFSKSSMDSACASAWEVFGCWKRGEITPCETHWFSANYGAIGTFLFKFYSLKKVDRNHPPAMTFVSNTSLFFVISTNLRQGLYLVKKKFWLTKSTLLHPESS